MWKHLIKNCYSIISPTNPGNSCKHEGLFTNNLVYTGEDIPCAGILNGMSVEEVIQRMDNYICGLELTQQFLTIIEENIQEFSSFILLVNEMISCNTINNCIQCNCYNTNIIIPNGTIEQTDNSSLTITWKNCLNEEQGQVVTANGEYILGCVNLLESIIVEGLIDGVVNNFAFTTNASSTCC